MRFNVSVNEQFVFAHKPAGVATHSPGDGRAGFVEYLSRGLEETLKICHRLDRDTSGAIVFARNAGAAALIAKEFAERRVEKEYLAITDRPVPWEHHTVHSIITGEASRFRSTPSSPAESNSETFFEVVLRHRHLTLLRARPRTGKPHQIRLHAAASDIPVLGDPLYGGTPAPRLMLHAERLRFSIRGCLFEHVAPPPSFFGSLKLFDSPRLISWLSSLDRRRAIYRWDDHDTVRLVHSEDGSMRCDKLGPVTWCYWYGEEPESKLSGDLATFIEEAGAEHWFLSFMENRGNPESTHRVLSSGGAGEWEAQEDGIRYLFSGSRGRSPGLFLDQRLNRHVVRDNARGKRVLNLFCYTGGFSLAAAKGGATEVVSVDTSRQTLEWAQDNFARNGLEPARYSFLHDDARDVLRKFARQRRTFDLVVCDPPSFARSKGGVFSIERDLDHLIEMVCAVVEKRGHILLSTNYEKMTQSQLEDRVAWVSRKHGFSSIRSLTQGWDFELPGSPPLMKSVWVSR